MAIDRKTLRHRMAIFTLILAALTIVIVGICWDDYQLCTYPLNVWLMVDFFIFLVVELLMMLLARLENGVKLGTCWKLVLSAVICATACFCFWTVVGTVLILKTFHCGLYLPTTVVVLTVCRDYCVLSGKAIELAAKFEVDTTEVKSKLISKNGAVGDVSNV